METVVYILKIVYCIVMVLLLFNVTIFVHEYGHFLLARWRGLQVDEFSIWFGPAIWQKRIGDVLFSLRSIPLGGYVKLPQLQPDDPIEGKSQTPKEQLPPIRPIDKIPTLFAGSVFNFLFAIVIATFLWIVGVPVDRSLIDTTVCYVAENSAESAAGLRAGDKIVAVGGNEVHDWIDIKIETALAPTAVVDVSVLRNGKTELLRITPSKNALGLREINADSKQSVIVGETIEGAPARVAGLKPGDRIVSVNRAKLRNLDHLVAIISASSDKSCEVRVDRDGRRLTFNITPKFNPDEKRGMIGIRFESDTILIHPTPIKQITAVILQMGRFIGAFFHHKETGVGVKDLAGQIGIVDHLYRAVASDIRLALYFLVLLNVNLAILNLLPLPVLDGGHIMFTLLEWIRKKPLNLRLMEGIQTAFVVLLLAFVVYVSFNDVKRLLLMRGIGSKPEPAATAPPSK